MSDTSAMNSMAARSTTGCASQAGPAIDVSGLIRSFGRVEALRGLDMTVQYGSITGFVGNNGAGKTTTIHSLLGFIPPHSGSMRVLGLDPRSNALKIREHIGFFPERDQPYDWMKVRVLFDMGAAAYPAWDRSIPERLCTQFDVDAGKRIKELSKGMVAKTKLIFALAHCPELLILDEPTSGLDPAARYELLQMLRQLTAEQRVTTLFSSHNLDDVAEIATDLVVIHEGRSIYVDRMSAIRSELRLIEAPDWSGDPPPALQALVIKAVQQGGTAYWLVRSGTPAIVEELVRQNEASFRAHSLSLEGVFLFLTRGWIELGTNGTPSR